MPSLFQKGQSADRLLLEGDVDEAMATYLEIIEQAGQAKTIDGFVLAKSFLGIIIAEAMNGNFDDVLELADTDVTDESIDNLQRIGLLGLQKGMVSMNDYTIFYNLACFSGDVTKHDPIQEKLRTITLSEWVRPQSEMPESPRN